jgi:hypothetical protein
VWQHDRVEIIPNDQGNRVTPSYVAFTDTERLVGDAAKNQERCLYQPAHQGQHVPLSLIMQHEDGAACCPMILQHHHSMH